MKLHFFGEKRFHEFLHQNNLELVALILWLSTLYTTKASNAFFCRWKIEELLSAYVAESHIATSGMDWSYFCHNYSCCESCLQLKDIPQHQQLCTVNNRVYCPQQLLTIWFFFTFSAAATQHTSWLKFFLRNCTTYCCRGVDSES